MMNLSLSVLLLYQLRVCVAITMEFQATIQCKVGSVYDTVLNLRSVWSARRCRVGRQVRSGDSSENSSEITKPKLFDASQVHQAHRTPTTIQPS